MPSLEEGVLDSGSIPDPWTPPSIGAQARVDLNDAPLDEKKKIPLRENGFSSYHKNDTVIKGTMCDNNNLKTLQNEPPVKR